MIVPLGCPVCKKFMLVHKSVFSLGTGSKWCAPAVTGIHGDPALYSGNRQIACASLTFRRGAPVHVSAGHRGQTHACGFCVAFLGKVWVFGVGQVRLAVGSRRLGRGRISGWPNQRASQGMSGEAAAKARRELNLGAGRLPQTTGTRSHHGLGCAVKSMADLPDELDPVLPFVILAGISCCYKKVNDPCHA